MAANFFSDNSDIKFHLNNTFAIDSLYPFLSEEEKQFSTSGSAQDYVNGITEILEGAGQIAAKMAEGSAKMDRNGSKLQDGKVKLSPQLLANLQLFKDFGLLGGDIAPKYGGYGIPHFIAMLGAELINRACPSTALSAHWYGSIARIIDKYGSDTLKQEWIPKLAKAEVSGNMALTEADAGSDLGAIKSFASRQKDGTYKLYGAKRFITNGHAEISLVLAKSHKGAEGLHKLSLYLCPREIYGKENIKILKLEDKVGLHGSPTAELAYDGATAYLLGRENEGFRYMLDLMNESRIGVGFQAVGLMEATLRMAKDYAEQRNAWGKPIAKHELIAERLLTMEVELQGGRSLCYATAFAQSLKDAIEERIKDGSIAKDKLKAMHKEHQRLERFVRTRTPLIKYWLAEKAVQHARENLQIHGGYGFTKEYRAEFWLRESLIYPLYEGTSQIQALMCTKDLLKEIARNPSLIVERTLELRVNSFKERNPLAKQLLKLRSIAWHSLLAVLWKLTKQNVKYAKAPKLASPLAMAKLLSEQVLSFKDLSPALLHAERLTEMQSLAIIGECLAEDASKDKSRTWLLKRFLFSSLARAEYLQSLISSDDEVLKSRLA